MPAGGAQSLELVVFAEFIPCEVVFGIAELLLNLLEFLLVVFDLLEQLGFAPGPLLESGRVALGLRMQCQGSEIGISSVSHSLQGVAALV